MISVLCLLKKDGVNIEKAYTHIVQAGQDESLEISEPIQGSEDESVVVANLFSAKGNKKTKLKYEHDSSNYAD